MRRRVLGLAVPLALLLVACSAVHPPGDSVELTPTATPGSTPGATLSAPSPALASPAASRTDPRSAVSPEKAIELASEHTTLRKFVAVAAGRFAELNTQPRIGPGYDIKPDDLVWAVTFSGDVEICPPRPGECFSRPGTAIVFLDFATGAFRGTQVHSPG